jgi:hypothetical protein
MSAIAELKRRQAELEAQIREAEEIEAERIRVAEEQARLEEERRVAEEARREAEEAEARRLAEEAEARRLVEEKNRIDVSMTEESEWIPMSPWSRSMVLLPLLEAQEKAEGSRSKSPVKARKRKYAVPKGPCFHCTSVEEECLRTG